MLREAGVSSVHVDLITQVALFPGLPHSLPLFRIRAFLSPQTEEQKRKDGVGLGTRLAMLHLQYRRVSCMSWAPLIMEDGDDIITELA